MPFPPTCQSPVTCDNRPSRKVGDTWLCLACFEYTEHHNHLPIPEEPMSQTIPDQILAHLKTRPVVTNHELQCALGVTKSSISSALATLRNRGLVAPSDGTGTARLVAPPAESALPDAVPGYPLLWQSPDRQGGAVCVRGTRVDVVTLWANAPAESAAHAYNVTTEQAQAAIDYVNEHPELQPPVPEDTVQTSEADVLRAEVARLTEELATSNMAFDGQSKLHTAMIAERDRLIAAYHTGATVEPTDPPVTIDELCSALSKARGWYRDLVREKVKADQLTVLHGVLDAQGLSTNPAELGNELDKIRASMLRSSNENRELRAERSRCSAVRLEWSPWQQDSGIWETYLRLKIGNIDVSIGRIVYQHRIYEAALHHSDRDGGVTTKITGTSLADVGIVYVAAMQSAGLPVVSIPALPESA